MRAAGIDIGSRSIELVVVDGQGKVLETCQTDTGFDPIARARTLMARAGFDRIMATGYGRGLVETAVDGTPTVTEIKAHARGVRQHFPRARAVLDIGGQDSKAIALTEAGRVRKFEMNDRCAAGTGKFLEIMARNLGFELDDFGPQALEATGTHTITSMCTVFAESEVTSLIARGADRRAIARGLHLSVAKRAAAMVSRTAPEGPVVFSGGVARNPCIRTLLAQRLGRQILVPDQPQMMGALGAALILRETLEA